MIREEHPAQADLRRQPVAAAAAAAAEFGHCEGAAD
jgi:hypothetical protein